MKSGPFRLPVDRAFTAQGAGTIRTLAGDYDWAFYGAGALAMVASVMAIAIRRIQAEHTPAVAAT